jgi:t-SNARE complex subunit (syntaxin)
LFFLSFSDVCSEVSQAINGVNTLYKRWQELLQTSNTATDEEFAWTANELKNGVRSIEFDLQDLDETVAIVEANPQKFKLAPGEVASRKKFISDTRKLLGEIKQALLSSKAQAKIETDKRESLTKNAKPQAYNKFSKLEDAMRADNQSFLEQAQQQQQEVMNEQDQDLSKIGSSVVKLKEIGNVMGDELDTQSKMLDELDGEVDSTSAKMRKAISQTGKLLTDTADKKPWLVIGVLAVVLLVLIVVVFMV